MTKIGRYKNLNYIHSKEDWEKYEKERVMPIKQNFVHRKKELLKFSNESLKTMQELLKFNNLYYIKERTFFTEKGDLFYADFYIPELQLVIEIDGGYHETDKRKYLDKAKELLIAGKSIATVRFSNEEVFEIPTLMREHLLKKANIFWETNKKDLPNFKDVFDRWKNKSSLNKDAITYKLKKQFTDRLKNFYQDFPIEEFNKNGDVLWVFENIFECHYKTGLKFKEVLDKFNMNSRNWKTRLRYKE